MARRRRSRSAGQVHGRPSSRNAINAAASMRRSGPPKVMLKTRKGGAPRRIIHGSSPRMLAVNTAEGIPKYATARPTPIGRRGGAGVQDRSEEHTSELQS